MHMVHPVLHGNRKRKCPSFPFCGKRFEEKQKKRETTAEKSEKSGTLRAWGHATQKEVG